MPGAGILVGNNFGLIEDLDLPCESIVVFNSRCIVINGVIVGVHIPFFIPSLIYTLFICGFDSFLLPGIFMFGSYDLFCGIL